MRINRWCSVLSSLVFLSVTLYILRYPAGTYLLDSTSLDDSLAVPTSSPLLGSPKPKFRGEKRFKSTVTDTLMEDTDGLRPDLKYISGWTAGGLTNAFISHVNLIYIAILAGRIPVLPPFTPVHVDTEPGVIQVGEVFDLQHLSKMIQTPVMEWSQLKDFSVNEIEDLGCWSAQETLAGHFHLSPQVEKEMHLNFSYTRVPESTRLVGDPKAYWANYMSLASLSFPEERRRALDEAKGKKASERPFLEPDDHMMCFDLLYYAAAAVGFEWEKEWSPAWRFAGVHMRWTQTLERITKGMISRALGYDAVSQLQPFITVHIRRTDFKQTCSPSVVNCLPPLSAYAKQVAWVKEELRSKRGLDVANVLVTSDEKDERWWMEVADLKWRRIDHIAERSEKLYGNWLVPVIDVVAQSLGSGFVGTDHSTMSLVTAKRVIDWHNGVVKMVKWDPYSANMEQ